MTGMPLRIQPHGGEGGRPPGASLSPEAVAEGALRLGWLGLAYALGSIVLGHFGRFALEAVSARSFTVPDLCGLAATLMGFAVWAVVRRGTLASKRLLDLGLAFWIAGALAIAVREFWSGLPQAAQGVVLPLPAECVWLLAYPVVVPNTPRKILVASLLAASMGPLGLALAAAAAGRTVPAPMHAAAYFLTSNYMCAFLAYLIARMVHRSSLRLARARAIGSYALMERIGTGGMGEVWWAQHRLLARPAAIKLIRRDKLGESLCEREAILRRFEREARDTAALRCTHTIGVYDFGLTEEGDFYYVMELLEGLSLTQLVRRFGPLGPGRTVYLLRQVCASLGEAHAHGLVHRDIKPANIFTCRLGPEDDFVKVLDFGLVKHRGDGGATVSRLTVESTVAGTPGYMAPEVALGRADVDGRADIYALGCVAYYLLTGKPVFSRETPMARVLAHLQSDPVPPSARTSLDIPEELDALILDCLARDPSARPASVEEVSRRLAASVGPDAWTAAAARAWWEDHQGLGVAPGLRSSSGGPLPVLKLPIKRPMMTAGNITPTTPSSRERERATPLIGTRSP